MRRLALALTLSLFGCSDPEPTDTSGLRTNELSLQIVTETDEFETRVFVGVYSVSELYARLALLPGEKLLLRVEGALPIELEADGQTYRARVARIEGDFALDLERGNDSARGTIVHLPPPFTITPPPDGLHLDKPFALTWSPAVATARVTAAIESECVRAAPRTLEHDSGSFTWSAADFRTTEEPLPCTATIKLVRDGGSIELAAGLGALKGFRSEQKRAFGVFASRP